LNIIVQVGKHGWVCRLIKFGHGDMLSRSATVLYHSQGS